MPTLIPIIDAPSQRVSISTDDGLLILKFLYNFYADRWTIDIFKDETALVLGRKLVAGVDLIRSFNLNIGAIVIVNNNKPDTVKIDRNTLIGNIFEVYHVSESEKEALKNEE